ncbi:hypothetical protein C6361_10755 [Plantactinospora sp. BC1]|uniref:hypothetical protein n=1 Tax=Plantactinospora sp. BC1 TaxID=2108470 RepID=UPI000D1587EF|nr:hypothetical protein [Plantactinospora sp. BC1]AVT29894.1 hypothetical protein C6361_10755 [Plantactinospora sp. BC1]
MDTPEASAAWAAEQVAGELREAYLTVAAAAALLERTGAGSAHPELRQARRCTEDALDLANHAEQLLGGGIRRVHERFGRDEVTSIGQVAGMLTVSQTKFAEVAERIAGLPDRLRGAGQRLRDAGDPDYSTDVVTEQWSQAAEQLGSMTASLTEAAGALATYTDRLTGATS